jgi:hypothetical protein
MDSLCVGGCVWVGVWVCMCGWVCGVYVWVGVCVILIEVCTKHAAII